MPHQIKAPIFFAVPAATPAAQCRSCKATIYWIETARSRKMPIDCDVDGAHEPTKSEPGRGVSHFATCPDHNSWRKPR